MSFKSSTKRRWTEEQSHEQSQLHEEQPVLLKSTNGERAKLKVSILCTHVYKFCAFLGMLHWFVEENVVPKALDGIAIEESNVEVDPNNLCSGVADVNVTLEKIQKFFTDDA